MDQPGIDALRIALTAARDECERGLLGNLLEGHLKVVMLQSLLAAGYSIMEGTNRKDAGKVLTFHEGKIAATLATRPPMAAAPGSSKQKNSPDIRVWAPVRLIIELQVRSQLGSQGALSSDNILDDLQRVGRGAADVLVLAADRPIYDSLRGLKSDNRGRPAKYPDAFAAAFPDSAALPDQFPPSPQPSLLPFLEYLGASVMSAAGIERVILAMWRRITSA